MLLSQAIATQQNLYNEIQAQIEALQEKQREIQRYLQRLGSVESKMESAAQLLQEAINEIQNTCPDELPAYQDLIGGLFGDSPIAQIEASSIEPEAVATPEPTPNPTPGDSKDDSKTDIKTTITVTATAVDNNTPTTPDQGKEVAAKPNERDFSRLSWKGLQKLAASYGASPKGKTRSLIEKELSQLGITQSAIDKVA